MRKVKYSFPPFVHCLYSRKPDELCALSCNSIFFWWQEPFEIRMLQRLYSKNDVTVCFFEGLSADFTRRQTGYACLWIESETNGKAPTEKFRTLVKMNFTWFFSVMMNYKVMQVRYNIILPWHVQHNYITLWITRRHCSIKYA